LRKNQRRDRDAEPLRERVQFAREDSSHIPNATATMGWRIRNRTKIFDKGEKSVWINAIPARAHRRSMPDGTRAQWFSERSRRRVVGIGFPGEITLARSFL
jgi:hypothetical protein